MEEKFLEVYEEHADALFRYCYFKVYDRERAKDLVQEAYTRTWAYLREGKEVINLRAFLYKILHNVIVDDIRRKKAVSLDQILDEGVQFASDTRESAINSETREVLDKLAMLEEKDREVLEMRYVEDLSVSEIAKILGTPVNLISVRIYRALKKLKGIIEKGK